MSMLSLPHDPSLMQRALDQARAAMWRTSPNPRVGCVIASADGTVLGEGGTQQAGGPHAEIMALRDAAAHGRSVRGATAYVTLEPCAHHGRTGPCCDALVAAGIARVVASMEDPNPLVAGQGFARLQAAGVRVEVGLGAEAARELNLGFLSRMVRKRPWVRLKAALSAEGSTALANGQSQWITGDAARADGHAWRARACAVLTGVGTVLSDDPLLDVRAVQTPRQPHLVVLDSRLRTPPQARLWAVERQRWIYAAAVDDNGRRAALEARGAQIRALPDGQGRVDLPSLLQDLAQRGVNELHIEAGAELNGAWLAADLVDELLLYVAPRIVGPGRPLALWGPLTRLDQARDFEWQSCEQIGRDLRLVARRTGPVAF
ncbi:bifunctional diaminohydroxyphosphoribosylaminopyrimidine deaminase/5-amino-6-(5-phosphoribosylamino)uracil reductase RibD [Acidovorax lacteus]|uniref:Riboflavin biosynthesis protein RibD n=1 Tax=Acidovorax lacteus TaxID=1924988 RepID=A0ABP8LH31_9BURK